MDYFQPVLLQGFPGPLITSKIEFFATLLNIWKLLPNNSCLKESHLRYARVSESAFDNQTTISSFRLGSSFHVILLNEKILLNDTYFFLFILDTENVFCLSLQFLSLSLQFILISLQSLLFPFL